MFSRKRMLIQYDPEELTFPELLRVQTALLARLILVNDEILRRDKDVQSVAAELPNVESAREIIDRLTEMNGALLAKIDRRQGKISK